MRCLKTIVLAVLPDGRSSETYCFFDRGHDGPCGPIEEKKTPNNKRCRLTLGCVYPHNHPGECKLKRVHYYV